MGLESVTTSSDALLPKLEKSLQSVQTQTRAIDGDFPEASAEAHNTTGFSKMGQMKVYGAGRATMP